MDQLFALYAGSERIIISIIGFILMMSIVVFIHEFGHYYIARLCGVRVTDFSIGFGKKLCSYKDSHGTSWSLSLIPLGGYVRFFGDRSETSEEDKAMLEKLPEEEKKDTFFFKPIKQKIAIIFAGPAANFILTYLLLFAINFILGVVVIKPVIHDLKEDSVAMRNDIRPGDMITKINNTKVKSVQQVQQFISKSYGDRIHFKIMRDGEIIEKSFAPDMVVTDFSQGQKIPMIGVVFANNPSGIIVQRYQFLTSISKSATDIRYIFDMTLIFFKRLFSGQANMDQIGGPIKIGDAAGSALKSGIWSFLMLMALISMSIGIINLFPVPMLDGGHILFYTLEAMGIKLNQRLREAAFKVGFVIIISIMAFTIINDFLSIGY